MRARVALAVLLFVSVLGGCVDTDERANQPFADEDGREVGREVKLVKVVDGLDDPVFVTHAGDGSGRLFIVEQAGRVQVFDEASREKQVYLDITAKVRSGGEQGLLGLAFAPDHDVQPGAYVLYTAKPRGDSVLAWYPETRGRLDADAEEVLLEVDQPYANHNGGMLAFGPDGMLYVGLGDGGAGGDPHGHGQDPATLLGSILRLDVDGGSYVAPSDNPFIRGGGAPEVWAYGLRNPWRFSFDRATGDLFIADVGQNAFEEVSVLRDGEGAGANLGWNVYEGSARYATGAEEPEDAVFPVAEYRREAPHCSVTGGYVYRGDAVGSLQGIYVFSDYCSGRVWGLEETRGAWEFGRLFESGRRVSSFGEDEAGELYLVDHAGIVLRFAEVPAHP